LSQQEPAPAGNDAFAWARFNPDAYVEHYYGDPHPDDDRVVRLTCAALAAGAGGRRNLDVIDVGTGPNLFPWFAALPYAARLSACEYAPSNVAWLRRELAGGKLRPQWRHFWNVARRAHAVGPGRADLPANPIRLLHQRATVLQGSIFDLPARRWDAATMFFCAESITQRQDEFERACAAFARCVRPGGVLAAAFLAGSRGYSVDGEDYPAVSISAASLRTAFRGCAKHVHVTRIGAMGAEIRSGYSGMLFLRARAA